MTHDTRATASARRADLAGAVDSALEDRRLLTHPFYQRWEAGELRPAELAEYAVHYRAFEAVLPEVLGTVVDQLMAEAEFDAAEQVARNLADELDHPEPHLALFDAFAAALPDSPVATGPSPAALALAETYRELARRSPAAAIATTKGDGLRRWYGMDDAGTRFWDVHSSMDADHGDWAVDALDLLGADAGEVADAARLAADAWWALLDERQAEAVAV